MAELIIDPEAQGYDPMAVVVNGLAAQARGEEPDEESIMVAATIIVAGNMVEFGLPADAVLRQFENRDHQFRFVYDGETNSVEVSVEWLDEDDG